MVNTLWKSIILPDKVYQQLKELKLNRQIDLKKDSYSFHVFIEFLCELYEKELESMPGSPLVSDIPEGTD